MRNSSMHSVRPSHAGSSLASQASLAAQNAKLKEKMKEFEALRALERLGNEYVRRLEAIELDCNAMANAGKVQGDVLSQWPEMFRILSLSRPQAQSTEGGVNEEQQTCEMLVRIPIEDLQEQPNGK